MMKIYAVGANDVHEGTGGWQWFYASEKSALNHARKIIKYEQAEERKLIKHNNLLYVYEPQVWSKNKTYRDTQLFYRSNGYVSVQIDIIEVKP